MRRALLDVFGRSHLFADISGSLSVARSLHRVKRVQDEQVGKLVTFAGSPRGRFLVQMCFVANGSTHLSTWVTAETKQRFIALARELGLSESALLKRWITLMLRTTEPPESALVDAPTKVPRNLRLYVRLGVDDHRLLRERATARCMPGRHTPRS